MIGRWSLVRWLAHSFCVFTLVVGAGARAQAAGIDLPVQYMCDRESIFATGQLASDLVWQSPKGLEFEVAPGATCWMRFSMPEQDASTFNGTQFLRISQEQGLEIFLYDARGQLVAAAPQNRSNIRSVSSQTVAVFPVDQNTPRTLFGKVHSTNLLYTVRVSIDRNDHDRVISDGQRRDATERRVAVGTDVVGVLETRAVVAARRREVPGAPDGERVGRKQAPRALHTIEIDPCVERLAVHIATSSQPPGRSTRAHSRSAAASSATAR